MARPPEVDSTARGYETRALAQARQWVFSGTGATEPMRAIQAPGVIWHGKNAG